MVAHLLKDGISGIKMINYSAKQRHQHSSKIRFFIGGTLLTMITAITTYVSTMYNWLLPQVSNLSFKWWLCMSTYLVIISHHFSSPGNTEIITNSVIILFICDLDELLYAILMVGSRCCVVSMSQECGSFCWIIVQLLLFHRTVLFQELFWEGGVDHWLLHNDNKHKVSQLLSSLWKNHVLKEAMELQWWFLHWCIVCLGLGYICMQKVPRS